MLEIVDLTVYRGGGAVLDRLSMNLPMGSINGLVGRNGAGKTTLLEAINGSIKARSGSVTVAGKSIRRSDVTYVPTNCFIYPGLTVRDYLELFSADNKRFEVRSWAQSFCLEQDQLTETLSTGERQKLALITALALARPLLLLDEPFRGLDFESTELIRAVLGNLAAAGVLVVLTSHALEVLASVADLIYLLEDGRVNWSSAGAGDNSDISYLRGRMVGEQAEIADLSKQVSPDETPGSP